MKPDFTSPCPTPPKPPGFSLWGAPGRWGVCGRNQNRELAPWTSWECLKPLQSPWTQVASGPGGETPQDLSPPHLDFTSSWAQPATGQTQESKK